MIEDSREVEDQRENETTKLLKCPYDIRTRCLKTSAEVELYFLARPLEFTHRKRRESKQGTLRII